MISGSRLWSYLGTFAFSIVLMTGASFAQLVPPGTLPFGVYDPDGDFSAETDVSIEHLFLPWEDVDLQSLLAADAYALQRNRSVLITIEPWTWDRNERNTPEALQAGIKSGDYDQYMRSVCEVVNTMKSDVTIRWAQEKDDHSGQFIWAGWKPETYIAAYRKSVDVCRAVAPNTSYMWSPLGYENMASYYPGNDYVDVIGLSVFGLQPWENEKFGKDLCFEDILRPRYERAIQFDLPVVVAELGYVGNREYVDKWRTDIRQSQKKFPELVSVVYFNQKEVHPWPDDFGLPDWRVKNQIITYTKPNKTN